MKQHTSELKNVIKTMGKQIDSIITYGNTILHEELYAVTPMFEGNILKSIMKQLDVESSVDIPLETIINYQLGIKVGNSYEYLDYGNYVVIKSEKQEDLDRYKITCYDKMVYSMKQNEELGIEYPISLKNYLIAVANKIGLQVENTQFANQDRMIPAELYVGLDYTYRDILDEIAQATGSNIIINENDKLEVKYFTDTEDTIDEEYLKDVNVNFGEKYGPVNTIVLSRSGGADNIYYPDPLPEFPIELKISDNQLMNDNNRVDYLPELYEKLNGLEFYINDFSSTGICYYEPCDIYHVEVRNKTYKCVMLNDEINVTAGIEELIHTDLPEQSQTDYTKADKTDRAINNTYIIVDKQNQKIEEVVGEVGQYNTRISSVEQEVDRISQLVQNAVEYKRTIEGYTQIHLTDAMEEDALSVEVRGNVTYISDLYPREDLYPSADLYINMEGEELR